MSNQRILQLLVSFAIITVIAFVSEKSRSLAAIVAVMPINVTIALWLVSTNSGGDSTLLSEFSRMVLFGLFPGALFIAMCWFGFDRGWSFPRVIFIGYAVWMITMGLYKGIEWWLAAG